MKARIFMLCCFLIGVNGLYYTNDTRLIDFVEFVTFFTNILT